MSTTLLDYLTTPNPPIDNTYSKTGSNTDNFAWDPIEGVQDWDEFNYETLLSCYGDLLKHPMAGLLDLVPTIPSFPDCEIWDEDSLEALLVRWNLALVSTGLSFAHSLCGSGWKGGEWDFQRIYMARGGLASFIDDRRIRPDWAAIQQGRLSSAIASDDLPPPYLNLCPGDTKLSTKWKSSWRNITVDRVVEEFSRPLSQLLSYCLIANSRYGYILTQEELVVVRVTMSTDPIQPLSTSRPRRITAQYFPSPGHVRDHSITSAPSEMSLDATGSSYTDHGKPAQNYDALEIRSVLWTNRGKGMTVNLALWWIHMMAKEDNSIRTSYPPLDSWTLEPELDGKPRYRHNTSGRHTYQLPKAATILDSRGSSGSSAA